jgi:mevalonate kinase
MVRERRTRLPTVVDPIFDAIDQCGREASRVIEQQQHHQSQPAADEDAAFNGGAILSKGSPFPKSPMKMLGVSVLDPVEQLDVRKVVLRQIINICVHTNK